jgi:hypothetical protein
MGRATQIPGAWSTTFCTVTLSIFRILIKVSFLSYKTVYQFTFSEQKEPDNSEVYRSLQNCGSAVWNTIYTTILSH